MGTENPVAQSISGNISRQGKCGHGAFANQYVAAAGNQVPRLRFIKQLVACSLQPAGGFVGCVVGRRRCRGILAEFQRGLLRWGQ